MDNNMLSSKIIEILNAKGVATVEEISKELNVDKEIIKIFLRIILGKNKVTSTFIPSCNQCPFRKSCKNIKETY